MGPPPAVVLRYVTTGSGVQCVMMAGIIQMPE